MDENKSKETHTIEVLFEQNGIENPIGNVSYGNSEENENKANYLLAILNKPWTLIKEGGKLGVKGVKRFFSIILAFGFTNGVLLAYALYRSFQGEFEFGKLGVAFVVLLLGLGFTIYAGYKAYNYVVMDTFRVIYGYMTSLIKSVSSFIIEKVGSKSAEFSKTKLEKTIDVGKMVHSRYKKLPKFVRRGLVLALKRVPLAGFVIDLHSDISTGNNEAASQKLYVKIDAFITETVFGSNNTRWAFWMLPLNIAIVLILIWYKIG